jgi:hypothetical protein
MSSILIALDVDRIAQADTLVTQLAGQVGGFKVGKPWRRSSIADCGSSWT